MATLIKRWDFTTDTEGFALTQVTRLSSGELQTIATGRNTKVDGYITLSGATYASLGVPASSAVNSVILRSNHRCAQYNVVDYVRWDGLFNGASAIPLADYAGVTAYAVTSSSSIPLTGATEETTFSLQIDSYCDNANNASAVSEIRWDYIEIEVDYTPPIYDYSGSVAITASAAISVNGKKNGRASLEITAASAVEAAGKKHAGEDINTTAAGAVETAGRKQASDALAITAATQAAVSGKKAASETATITTSAAVSVNGKKVSSGSLEIATAAEAAAHGEKNAGEAITITANGSVSADGKQTYTKTGTVSIAAGSFVDITGRAHRFCAAGITGPGIVSAEGKKAASGSFEISGPSTAEAAGNKAVAGAFGITEETQAAAAGKKASDSRISLTAAAEISGSGNKGAYDKLAIIAGSTLSVYGGGSAGGRLEITAQAMVNITGAKGAAGTTALTAAGLTVAAGKKKAPGAANVEGAANLSLTGEKCTAGSVAILISSQVDITGAQKYLLRDPTVTADITQWLVTIELYEIRPEIATIEYELQLTITAYEFQISSGEHYITTEVIGVPFIGATVKLNATFPSTAGDLAGLTNVKCVITDSDRNIIDTIEGEVIKEGSTVDQFFTYYNIPATGVGDLSYAWSGNLGEDIILLARKGMGRVWQE